MLTVYKNVWLICVVYARLRVARLGNDLVGKCVTMLTARHDLLLYVRRHCSRARLAVILCNLFIFNRKVNADKQCL